MAEQLRELVEEQRAELLDPRERAGAFERRLVQVPVRDRVPGLCSAAARLGLAGEQGGDVLGVGQPAQGDRAKLVAVHVGGQVGHQVAARVEGVGDPSTIASSQAASAGTAGAITVRNPNSSVGVIAT